MNAKSKVPKSGRGMLGEACGQERVKRKLLSCSPFRQSAVARAVHFGIDYIQQGLCFYQENGIVILVNSVMRDLSLSLTGETLINGVRFWAQVDPSYLEELPSADSVGTEPLPLLRGMRMAQASQPTVVLENGSVWTFSRSLITLSDQRIWMVEATDMTSRYLVSQELERENQQLSEANKRLLTYNKEVNSLVRQEEILETKARIHDEIGQTLAATKRFLAAGGVGEYQGIVDSWRSAAALLRQQIVPRKKPDPAEAIVKAGRAIGIDVQVSGALPLDDDPAIRIIHAAVREGMVNAVRHAGADVLYVSLTAEPDWYDLTIASNGAPPQDPVVEGGGLSNLRNRVEASGGVMELVMNPRLELRVKVVRSDGLGKDPSEVLDDFMGRDASPEAERRP